MGYRIGKQFSFDAAHHLPELPPGHKCARPHGHTYRAELVLDSEALVEPGFVADFGDLAPFKDYLDDSLDHRDLNEVLDFSPTSENLARHLFGWFVANVEPGIAGRLMTVRVSETPSTWAEYTRELP